MKELTDKLNKIQTNLQAKKDLFNKFGNYSYRSKESILESLKPLLKETGLVLTITDDIALVGDRHYVKSTCTVTNGEDSISTTGFAREPIAQKGMADPMITGSASSYASKYALGNLFAIDDGSRDADQLSADQAPKQATAQSTASNTITKPQAVKLCETFKGAGWEAGDVADFLSVECGVNKVADILKCDFDHVAKALEEAIKLV